MANAFNLESIVLYGLNGKDAGKNTVEELAEYIKTNIPAITETPEEIRAFFEKVFPGQNVTGSSEAEMEQRRKEYENAGYLYWRL